MPVLAFTLSPESLGKLHDALVCLGKFSEAVCIEAVHDKLTLTALNSSKSAYASFTLIEKFFAKYQFKGTGANPSREKFNCKIYNKALLSVFKGRATDPMREKDTAIERCDVTVEDGEGTGKSRFIIKIACRHGVLKTYRLTFESVSPMHALFVKESAGNVWSISSRTLREFVEHFGPGTEQLDIYFEDGRVSLTSYTEKIMSGNEVLKQPLHTTIAVDTLEFGEFHVEEKLHIVISVKDFKSIVSHASTINTTVKALYSHPSNPMQLTYSDEGLLSEFILMTTGEGRGASAAPNSRANSKRPASRPALEATPSSKKPSNPEMRPPSTSAALSLNRDAAPRSKVSRPSPPPPQPSIQTDALFFPEADDDRRWDPVNSDEEEDEMLLWDAGGNSVVATMNSGKGLQSAETQSQSINGLSRINAQTNPDASLPQTQRLAPTQRLSGIRGMFDD
ncbi:hypothetical protein OIDMADRAFT_49656 [Oidiodendron maius Zn]|uniref:DNA repair protein rad9 n=1 Tax=Oidiodendron maius (strain Zn) TaxID=913774 RepID=A0A0C3HVC7_OIDMZ|nr:hypothetical protein OIDMADRAFT_49656 [Oidiodendron maius Zn]